MKFFHILLLAPVLAAAAAAQGVPAPGADAAKSHADAASAVAAREQTELSQALAEAGSSPVDYIRALENHLAKYPNSPQRALIEKALAKSAMDASDNARIIQYGEKVLAHDKPDDFQLLDRLTRALLDEGGPDAWKRALEFAKRFEADVDAMNRSEAQGHLTPAQWSEQLDRMKARALVLEARATGNLGDVAQAGALAANAWKIWPTAEAAREKAWWFSKQGRNTDAIQAYAEAFTLEDPHSTEADRAQDRRRMGELYVKADGSEKGLGDLILRTYDQTSALMSERLADIKAKDPNSAASKVLDFTLPAVNGGEPLKLSSLNGKTVVMDFWATWCEPCRVQHPMIEKVRERMKNDAGVIFISVDTDEDHSLAGRFLHEQHWNGPAYFEAGLVRLLNITSIPTVLVIDPKGRTASRMSGFIPERFEDMLEHRILEAREAARTPENTSAPAKPGA
jgi:thiol-disulfide isomerase/thioredoxin